MFIVFGLIHVAMFSIFVYLEWFAYADILRRHKEVSTFTIIILLYSFFISILFFYMHFKDKKETREYDEEQLKLKNEYDSIKLTYQDKKKNILIPGNALNVTFLDHTNVLGNNFAPMEYLIWADKNIISLFSSEPTIENMQYYNEIEILSIPRESIQYFTLQGELFRETRISGGGGGGSSIGGAIIGGLLGGETGAIIGSRKEVEGVRSEIIEHDSRKTLLVLNENNQRKEVFLNHESFEKFREMIPEKNKNVVESLIAGKVAQQNSSEDKVLFQSRMLKQMLDEGIIDEAMFKEKIQRIMDN